MKLCYAAPVSMFHVRQYFFLNQFPNLAHVTVQFRTVFHFEGPWPAQLYRDDLFDASGAGGEDDPRSER